MHEGTSGYEESLYKMQTRIMQEGAYILLTISHQCSGVFRGGTLGNGPFGQKFLFDRKKIRKLGLTLCVSISGQKKLPPLMKS